MTEEPASGRPVLVAIAGPNGAGKTTFFHSHLHGAGLRFVNADDLALQIGISAYEAAEVADRLRRELVAARGSFVFETVFSDPVGEKVAFLRDAFSAGYQVILCFIGIADAQTSEARVAMRISQGGHDVPSDKLAKRFPRTLSNLKNAIRSLPLVLIYDNENLTAPYIRVAEFRHGKAVFQKEILPIWLENLL